MIAQALKSGRNPQIDPGESMVFRGGRASCEFHPTGEALRMAAPRQSGMKNQERLPFEYVIEEKQSQVTSAGGLPLVAETMTVLGVDDAVRSHLQFGKVQREFDALALVRATTLLMASGGDCLDDVERLREDVALCELLGFRFPSAGTLRNFLYDFHDEKLVEVADGKRARIPKESEPLKGLRQVVAAHIAAFSHRWGGTQATLDIDGTIIESHKKEALPHYLGGRGYQPVVAYWAVAEQSG
jgi:hypothetical protein